MHAGYSRFFSPPPFELVGNTTIGKFANTTAAPLKSTDDGRQAPSAANYYDLGVRADTYSKSFTVGIDSYYKQSTDLIDEGQFGAPIILTPFNYRYGQVYGVEFTGNYTQRPLPGLRQPRLPARHRQGHRLRASSTSTRRIWPTSPTTTSISITSSR